MTFSGEFSAIETSIRLKIPKFHFFKFFITRGLSSIEKFDFYEVFPFFDFPETFKTR